MFTWQLKQFDTAAERCGGTQAPAGAGGAAPLQPWVRSQPTSQAPMSPTPGTSGDRFKVKEGSASPQHSPTAFLAVGAFGRSQLKPIRSTRLNSRLKKQTFLKSVAWKERQSMQTSVSVWKLEHPMGLKSKASAVPPSPSSPLKYTGVSDTFLGKRGWFGMLAPGVGQLLFLALPLCIAFNQIAIKKVTTSLPCIS